MKTILLTGATGFIGRHIIKAIGQHTEYKDYKVVLLSSILVEGYKTIIHKDYTFNKSDFTSSGVDNIDIVIHAGAYTPKDNQSSNNVAGALSNIISLHHLIKELPNKPEKFIFFSTLDVYKPAVDEVLTESSVTEPYSLYGWSKLYGEKMLESWAGQENVTLQVLRIGHIYGSGEEKYQKIIPITIRKALQGQKPVIFTKGNELRSFLHISDCVNAVLAAIQLKEYKGPINIASRHAMPIKEIVRIIVDHIDPQLAIEIEGNEAPVRDLVFDNSKMCKYLSDEVFSFEEGVKEEISLFQL